MIETVADILLSPYTAIVYVILLAGTTVAFVFLLQRRIARYRKTGDTDVWELPYRAWVSKGMLFVRDSKGDVCQVVDIHPIISLSVITSPDLEEGLVRIELILAAERMVSITMDKEKSFPALLKTIAQRGSPSHTVNVRFPGAEYQARRD